MLGFIYIKIIGTLLAMVIQSPIKIVLYFIALLTIQFVPNQLFWVLFIVSQVVAFSIEKYGYLSRYLRMRWLWLSILLVFALTTPGEYVSVLLPMLKVTYEGLLAGCKQVAIILFAIASVVILFYRAKPAELVNGVHHLLKPLRHLGVPIEVVSVRLLLTLQYFNALTAISIKDINGVLRYFRSIDTEMATIDDADFVLSSYRLSVVEWVLLSVCLFIVYLVFVG